MALGLGQTRRLTTSGTVPAAHAATGRGTFGSRDAPWAVAFAVVVLLVCLAPDLFGMVAGPAGRDRVGTLWFARDFGQYMAAMRDGARVDSWLVHDRYTAEPHAPILMYTLYVGIGKLGAVTGLDVQLVFGAAMWVSRVALLASLWAFVQAFAAEKRVRRLAMLLAVGTMGLGGWALPLALIGQRAGITDGSELPRLNPYLEFNTLGVLFAAPHLMLGLALTLLTLVLYLRAVRGDTLALGGLPAATAALSLLHPFNLPTTLSVLGADVAWRWWGGRRRGAEGARRALVTGVLAVGGAAPLLLYSVAVFQLDSFWSSTYAAQNSMPAPPVWALPVDLGLVLIAAVAGWQGTRQWSPDARRLLWMATMMGLVWLYVPVPYQRRFAFGIQPVLALLAAAGLLWLNAWMREHAWGPIRRRLVNYTVAFAAVMTSIIVLAGLLASVALNAPTPVYLLSSTEQRAADWLAQNSTAQDLVLASIDVSNPLVGIIAGRTAQGHPVATKDARAKEALADAFYAAATPPPERLAIARRLGATIVFLGPRERALGVSNLDGVDGLDRVYSRDGVQVYRLARAT